MARLSLVRRSSFLTLAVLLAVLPVRSLAAWTQVDKSVDVKKAEADKLAQQKKEEQEKQQQQKQEQEKQEQLKAEQSKAEQLKEDQLRAEKEKLDAIAAEEETQRAAQAQQQNEQQQKEKNAATGVKPVMPQLKIPPKVINPGVIIPSPGAQGGNWDFETGDLRDWQCQGTMGGSCVGTAFATQPTYGDNVAARIAGVSANPQGNYWIGTYENRRQPPAAAGGIQGDGPVGTLVSRRFRIHSSFIRFRVGGGTSARGVRVQLITTEDVEQGGLLLEAAGQDDEVMRPITWDVRRFDGQECFIRIIDRGSGPWGHINVDDFRFDSGAPGPETFRGWDFESLEDVYRTWTMEGSAFERQPTFGDNVTSSRLGTPAVTLVRANIGGNYWDVPFPLGTQGRYWIGTYENRATPGDPWGGIRGDAPTGTMTSVDFQLNRRYVSFLIGGGGDASMERVELLVERNGQWVVAQQATGRNAELVRQEVWDAGADRGATARIRVVDAGSGGWGHINVDDFRFTDERPAPPPTAVWGFADTHAHPMAHLGFGGQLYWGDPEGPYETALAACEPAHGIHGTGLRDVGGALNIVGAVIPELLTLGFEEAGRWAADQGSQWTTGRPLPERTQDERDKRLMQAVFNIVEAVNPDVLLQLGVVAVERRIGHRTHGWPEMDGWPRFDSPMHQHMHREWIRRAYDGGLRLMVAHVVNTRIIGDLRPRPGAPLDDRAVTDAQLEAIHALARHNSTWMAVARTPAEARQIIGQNKLALILGVEVDSLNNWRTDANCTDEEVDAYLRHLYDDQDVRHIFPIHLAESPFGAQSLYDDIFNFNSWAVTGHLNEVRDGSDARGRGYEVQFRLLEEMPRAGDLIWGELRALLARKHMQTLTLPSGRILDVNQALLDAERAKGNYDAVRSGEGNNLAGHLNSAGLTERGRHAITEMMRLGMIIDVDHMSDLSTDETLRMAEARDANGLRGYPLASGHSSFREIKWRRGETGSAHKLAHESDKKPDTVARMRALGGIMAPITTGGDVRPWGRRVPDDAPGTSKSWAQSYLYAIEHMGNRSVALGTDMAILGGLGPRFGSWAAIGTDGDDVKAEVWMSTPGYRLTATPLAEGETSSRRYRRYEADAQRNGVRYATPIRNVLSYRFEGPDDMYSGDERDLWAAIIEGRSDTDIEAASFGGEILGFRTAGLVAWMKDVAKGVRAAARGASIDTLPVPGAGTNNVLGFYNYAVVQRAAWHAYKGTSADTITDESIRNDAIRFGRIARVVRQMDGANPPLTRLVVGNHDFDFNLDGLANYGLLPDMLQDVRNVGVGPEQMAPLFRSAEDYIEMWERCERMKEP